MPDYFIGTTKLALRPTDVVGKGGEADIYLSGGKAFKLYKQPNHPDLTGQPDAQKAAKLRLMEHQKKLPAFPKGLPSHVIAPEALITDAKGFIAGYRMPFLGNTEVLYRYGERSFRDQGVSDETAIAVLAHLHRTVEALHRKAVVIGDFNDLNVLVREREAYLVDADSMQYGPYTTQVFTAKFVDPLICDQKLRQPTMVHPHTDQTDWFAYLIMVMQVLLFVGPYGGVHKPADPSKKVQTDSRSLARLTVFDPDVAYPKPARHYRILPDALLDHFEQVFKKDLRGVPPLPLIEGLRFTTCTKCGFSHARNVCPSCAHVTKSTLKEVHTGTVSATKVIDMDGIILYATLENGMLRYLYYENGAYKREGGRTVLTAPLEPNIRFRISGQKTVFARGTQAVILGANGEQESISVDAYGTLPLLDANGDRIFYSNDGALMRTTDFGVDYPERVGDVLPNQTLFWVGDKLGFGFYRAAELSNFFVFPTKHKVLNDSVALPAIRGQLIDSTAYFSDSHVWFLTSTREGERTINRCHLISADGTHQGSAEATPGDGSWLGTLRGKCAAGDFLLAPTDDGVVRVALNGGTLTVVKEYPDTKRFVDADSRLFATGGGLLVVGRHDIWRLVITTP